MQPDAALGRLVTQMRLAGHDFETISLTLATGAVEALVAGGYRGGALDGGLLRVVEAMWDHVTDLRTMTLPPGTGTDGPRLVEPSRMVDLAPTLTALAEPKP